MSEGSHQGLDTRPDSNEVDGSDLPYASFRQRLLALMVDFAVAIATSTAPSGLILKTLSSIGVWTPIGPEADAEGEWAMMDFGVRLLVIIAFFLASGPIYVILFESSAWQATLGKRLLRIYVTDLRGQRISTLRATGRLFANRFSWPCWLALFNVIAIPASERRQAIHDVVARTLVMRGRPGPGAQLETWRIAISFAIPVVWMVGTFLLTA